MTSPRKPVVDEIRLAEAPAKLPHAPPFRLVDRVLAADLDRGTLVAEHRITAGGGLWPAELFEAASGAVVMASFPDVLIIEALCQAAACWNILDAAPEPSRPHLGYLVAISSFRFQQEFARRPTIGDTLLLHVERKTKMGDLIAFAATAWVRTAADLIPPGDLDAVASGQLLFAIG